MVINSCSKIYKYVRDTEHRDRAVRLYPLPLLAIPMAENAQAGPQAVDVTVNQPKNIDLKELARLTGTALDYIAPFVQNPTNNDE